MNVVCLFSAAMPNEVQMAYGEGAGSVQLVTAARLIRQEAEALLSFRPGAEQPMGRGEAGDIDPFRDVTADDVCVRVHWPRPEARPELDYKIAKAATADQLLCCALALDEYVRFGVWNHRMQQHVAQVQQQEANQRAAAAIAKAARMPGDMREIGRA